MSKRAIVITSVVALVLVIGGFLSWLDYHRTQVRIQQELDHTDEVARCMVLTGHSPNWCEIVVR